MPYNQGVIRDGEFVLNLVKETLNEIALKNESNKIRDNFAQYNKSVADEMSTNINVPDNKHPKSNVQTLRLTAWEVKKPEPLTSATRKFISGGFR